MVKPGLEVKLIVQGHFENTEVRVNITDTIRNVKAMVCLDWAIPVSNQTYYFRGLCATDDQILRNIGIEDGSTITMSVESKFLERVHPFHLRDPLTGLLPRKPISCSDRLSYDDVSLEQWRVSLQRQTMRSPMYGCFMNVGELNDSLKDKVATYIRDIDSGKAEEEYLSLDSLGRIHNILGHFREIIGPISRCRRPRIVCLGNESIGKSAEMERLTFMCIFPRGEERCTRVAVEIRCHRGPITNPVLRVISGRGMGTESDEEEDARENGRDCLVRMVVPLQKGAEEMQQQMSNIMDRVTAEYVGTDMPPEVCVDRYIVLDVTGPTLPDVTFVDFPGLAANDRCLLEQMLTRDFENFGEYSIYLHITKASEFTEDGPYAILQGFAGGQLLNQTVAIVTQMDLADRLPDQPDRAQQLIQLALGEKTADRDQLFPCGTFLVMNKDEKNDPPSGFESVYLRAEREKKFLAERGWLGVDSHMRDVAGNNALIEQIHRMYFAQLERTLLPQAIGKLQERLTALNRREYDLGRPAVVYPPSGAQLPPLLNRITTGIISTLQSKLSAILLKFEREHVEPLETDLSDVLTPTRSVPKLEVDKNIHEAYDDILACFADRKAVHMAFWLDELQMTLQADHSEVKLGRFTALIDALKASIEAKLDNFYDMLQERFQDMFGLTDVMDKFSCVICADRSEAFDVPMVRLSFKMDPVTLAHIMCDSMRIFSDTISNEDYISEVLQPCSLVEECRLDRFNIWTERRLLHQAISELLDLAHKFDSIGCVMCSGRLVSLCHANTASVLEIANDACVVYTCPQYLSDINCYSMDGSSQLEGRSGARFQVVDVGNGDVAFYCPSTSQYLCVKEEELTVHYVQPDEYANCLPPEVLFRAEFQPPPAPMAAHARSALSLYNVHSNSFVTVSAPVTESGMPTVTLVAPDANGLPPDNYAAVFLVVGNAEE